MIFLKKKGGETMPPSGFNEKAVKGFRCLLEECFADLKQEVTQGKHANLATAIDHEVKQIDRALLSTVDAEHQVEQGVLLMVGECYKKAQAIILGGVDPLTAVEQAVEQSVGIIARMHINDDGALVEKNPTD